MANRDLIKFTNCKILRNHKLVKDELWVRNGKIVDPEVIFYNEKIKPKIVYNMNQKIISPGFIDLQINGGYGIDFTNNTYDVEDGLRIVASGILANGVTSFCPTIVTTDSQRYKEILPKFKRKKGSKEGAEIIGVHLEGPFISEEKKGAHNKQKIREFDQGVETLKQVYGDLDNVSIITLAPEKEKASEVIDFLTTQDILVSIGHSSATFSDGLQAIHRGVTSITHLFNAMNPFHHRDPGLVGLISEGELHQMYYGLIADGTHVHPNSIKFAYKANPTGVVLITDAISAMGKMDGIHQIGDEFIEIKNNAAYITGTDTLCGSVAKMNECVKFFKESTGCSTVESLEAASLHPAQALGIETSKGTLAIGKDADFICIDEDFNVLSTWISGQCVYKFQ